jgi:hypothetical protein
MVRPNKRKRLFILAAVFSLLPLIYIQTEQPLLAEQPPISVVGRLALEKPGEEESLVLHAKDAKTYLIIGNLKEKLKDSLIELGQNNLISIMGNQDGRYNVACERFYKYEYNKQREKELKTDTRCIRYYFLEATEILFAKKSDEEIPPPKRDTKEEESLIAKSRSRERNIAPKIVGEIYGTISSVNLKSPIKTIEIANRDKENPLKKIILIISGDTRIVKKIGEQEPMTLSDKALKPKQEVTTVYTRDEQKREAIAITITKE